MSLPRGGHPVAPASRAASPPPARDKLDDRLVALRRSCVAAGASAAVHRAATASSVAFVALLRRRRPHRRVPRHHRVPPYPVAAARATAATIACRILVARAARGSVACWMRTLIAATRVAVLLLAVALAAACDKPATSNTSDAAAAASSAAAVSPAASGAAAASDAGAAAATPSKPTGKTVETPAGTASEVGDEIRLAGKTIYPPPECTGKDGCAKVKALRSGMEGIKLLRHFDGPGGPKSILLLQATTAGNACNGGPLFFVRVAKDAAPQYSDVFDHCGGPDPMVGAMPDKILINVPAHPPNRGTGTIPAKNMEYDIATGTLQAAAPSTKKRR